MLRFHAELKYKGAFWSIKSNNDPSMAAEGGDAYAGPTTKERVTMSVITCVLVIFSPFVF